MPVRAYETLVALFDDKPVLVCAKGSYEIVVPLCANVKFRIVVYVRYRVHYYRRDLNANADIYRPMLGIDAVALATGNDWRAIEAGAHAYASRSGRYTSLSSWGKDADGNLVGSLELPMAAGTVGGATRVHPAARAALKLMGVNSAAQLAEVLVAVGLAQNLAALRALASEGIQRGHMNLHARQVAIAAGAQGAVVETLARRLVEEKTVRIDRALEILNEWKTGKTLEGDLPHA